MNFRTLTNVRPVVDAGTKLVASPTKGAFKLSLDAAKRLGVADGDLLHIVAHPSEENVFFIGKGRTEGEGEDTTQIGSKLNRSGSYLNCSAAAAWKEMGNENFSTSYEVTEEEQADEGSNPYFKLGEVTKKAKGKRPDSIKKEEKEEDTPAPQEEAIQEAPESIEEAEEAQAPALDEL